MKRARKSKRQKIFNGDRSFGGFKKVVTPWKGKWEKYLYNVNTRTKR